MKNLLKISLGAVLAALPMVAHAEGTDPKHATNQNDATLLASESPKYELATSHESDQYAATAGYVKGAYNAAIKGINKLHENLNSTVSGLSNTYSTQTGVKNTVNAAKVNGSVSGATVSGTFSTSIASGSFSGQAVNPTMSAMTTWGSTSVGSVTPSATVNGTASGTLGGSVSGTANVDVNNASVSVASYVE